MVQVFEDKPEGFIVIGAVPGQPLKSEGILMEMLFNPKTNEQGIHYKRGDNRKTITWNIDEHRTIETHIKQWEKKHYGIENGKHHE